MHNCAKRNICNSILKLKIQVEHNDRLKKGQVPKKTIPATAHKTKRLFSHVTSWNGLKFEEVDELYASRSLWKISKRTRRVTQKSLCNDITT